MGKAKYLSAVFPFIFRENGDKTEILLGRRQNTGYMDGKWDIAGAGHVDEGENPRTAASRECMEELGLIVAPEDLTFTHLSHRISPDRIYYDIYFLVNKYSGEPHIMEPDKCDGLAWFDINSLPQDMVPCRRAVLEEYWGKRFYSEIVDM